MDRYILRRLVAIVLLALAARGAIILWKSTELTQDRDAYLGIAASLAEGRGYSSPGSTQPTAFRPPLYPLLLAVGPQSHIDIWVATLNLLAGAGTVLLTCLMGQRLGLGTIGSLAAALLVAVDPLLVRYASQPMTESVCTLLVTAWLWQTLRLLESPTVRGGLVGGALFGLATLCRPTAWIAGALVGCWVLWLGWRGRLPLWGCDNVDTAEVAEHCSDEARRNGRAKWGWSPVLAAAIGCLVIVLPWPVRNYYAMGKPILTTTHGGYTLLLGNNRQFFHNYARHPGQPVSDYTADVDLTSRFQLDLMIAEADGYGSENGETGLDARMHRVAWLEIQADLRGFLLATMLREYMFWNIVPIGDARVGWPPAIIWSVGACYAVLWVFSLSGLFLVIVRRTALWVPGLLVIIAFASVHLIYWSNARMRAPLVPILALLAVRGFGAMVRFVRPMTTAPSPRGECPDQSYEADRP